MVKRSPRLDIFESAISDLKTFQDADDPNSVVLVIEVNNMEKFVSKLNNPSTKVFKKKHTVIDPITVSLPVES